MELDSGPGNTIIFGTIRVVKRMYTFILIILKWIFSADKFIIKIFHIYWLNGGWTGRTQSSDLLSYQLIVIKEYHF